MSALRWGAFVPQGWKLEYTGWGAAEAWARSVELAQLAERSGYDHLWVYDHVETVPRREPTHCFEAFTMLAALSQVTSTAELGQLVTCSSYRNAGLLAKEAACIDVFSGGRLILGLGAGWYDREYAAYGYEYLADRDRLAVLEETITVIPRLWSEETVTFAGKHLQLDGAFCDPKPVRDRPPLWVGGGGEKVTLRIAAEHADATNWQVGLDQFVHKSRVLEEHCARDSGGTSTPSRGLTARTAGSSTPIRSLPPGSTRPAAGTFGGAGHTRATCGTTSWARSTRSPRRSRVSSTPGAGSSCCGSGTSHRVRASSGSPPRSCHRFDLERHEYHARPVSR